MNVLDYIASETERQSGTVREGLGMYSAWLHLRGTFDHEGDYIAEKALLHAHRLIKGDEFGGGRYRITPVTFRDGGHAANHQNIPRLMTNLFKAINSVPEDFRPHFANDLTQEFLAIHPYSDGNGRVASLLWNRLMGTLGDPEIMPYFFGEA